MTATNRNSRKYGIKGPDGRPTETRKKTWEDLRTEAQHDRDRLLYCSAFRRLAEITQVVSPNEGHVFHNRLTHTLKVAQIARRLAEKMAESETAKKLGGIDPDVVESAALAHDLGHPPFGHAIEDELNHLADREGFEGNAQSFRILTRLAVRTEDYLGLNLTAATLNAVLKYPWLRGGSGYEGKKWGAYHSDREDFEWAREALGMPGKRRSPEAELMDWADDIAYSVYDVEDFYRAGLIPLDQILSGTPETQRFLDGAARRLARDGKDEKTIAQYTGALEGLPFPARRLFGRYQGTREQRAALRGWTSWGVRRFSSAIQLRVPKSAAERSAEVAPSIKAEVEILKQLVWEYVIENPALVTQQHGQRFAVRRMFGLFMEKAGHNNPKSDFSIFPVAFRRMLEADEKAGTLEETRTRIIIDMLASFTERQIMAIYQRLYGIYLGSVLDAV